jgi:hypothetical protein
LVAHFIPAEGDRLRYRSLGFFGDEDIVRAALGTEPSITIGQATVVLCGFDLDDRPELGERTGATL